MVNYHKKKKIINMNKNLRSNKTPLTGIKRKRKEIQKIREESNESEESDYELSNVSHFSATEN